MAIEIELVWDIKLLGEDKRTWSFWFSYQAPACSFKFRIKEPHQASREAWLGPIEDGQEKCFTLSQGDSETIVQRADGKFTFLIIVSPPGATEKIKTLYELPVEAVEAPLCAAIDGACRAGMWSE